MLDLDSPGLSHQLAPFLGGEGAEPPVHGVGAAPHPVAVQPDVLVHDVIGVGHEPVVGMPTVEMGMDEGGEGCNWYMELGGCMMFDRITHV